MESIEYVMVSTHGEGTEETGEYTAFNFMTKSNEYIIIWEKYGEKWGLDGASPSVRDFLKGVIFSIVFHDLG